MMTPAEIIKMAQADRDVCKVVTAAGITINPEPEAPPNRPGLRWIPHQAVAGGPIAWVESEYDPSMLGTTETPIRYEPGVTLWPNYFYILDGAKKVWTGEQCIGAAWDDERFAAI